MQVKRMGVIVLAASLLVPAVWSWAASEKAAAKTDASAKVVPAKEKPADTESANKDAVRKSWQPLGRTVRLEFKLVAADEQPTFTVLCAGGPFSVVHDESNVEVAHTLKFTGEVHPTDSQDRIAVSYLAMLQHSNLNEGFDATFTTEGSVVLTLGHSIQIARLGDEPLMLTATLVE